LKIGETIKAVLVLLRKPTDFCLQPVANAAQIDKITGSVSAELEAGSAQELREGEACWAKFSDDNAWYRATVSKIKELEISSF